MHLHTPDAGARVARIVPTSVGAEGLVYVPQHMYEDQTTEKNGVADPLAAWWPSPKDAYVSFHLLPGVV